jgi:hypothetical protein
MNRKSILFEQYLRDTWVLIGNNKKLKSGFICRVYQNKIDKPRQMILFASRLLETGHFDKRL